MQTAKSRSSLVPPTSKQPPKWNRGMSFSLDLSKSKAPKVSDGTMNLEKELQKAKESERTMLESLISQTKQFEQTKISLEEAKLEIRSLQESIKSLEDTTHQSSNKNLEKSQSERKPPMLSGSFEVFRSRDDIGMVQKELELAAAAEEKSKKAMDGLALALKEVSTEASQVKARLSASQTELQVAEEESMQLKLEVEDLIATLIEKEKSFLHCMKISEEEIDQLKQESSNLIDSLRVSREDNAKLRDILKHAVNEATVVKEALEIVRSENSQLQDSLSEKEIVVQSIRQDYESLKVSERAAIDSVKELKGFLAATSNMDEYSIKPLVPQVKEQNRLVKLPSRKHNRGSHSLGGGLVSDDLEHTDQSKLNGMKLKGEPPASEKQKTTMFKRFGDKLSRSGFYK